MPEKLEDQSVVRATEGDTDELERLLRTLEPELRASLVIQPLWKRSLDADDVIQVSFLEAFLRIRALEKTTVSGFRAWMKALVNNNLRDAIRALERDKRPDARRRQTRGPGGESARTLFAQLSTTATGASAPAAFKDEVERLQAALAKLPESYRRVVQSLDLEERPVGEVAAELDRSKGAVYLLRTRAHDRLRELLAP